MQPPQSQPPRPGNEAERLARLHELMVLDTEAEPAFDNLAALASQVCGVPIGLLSLVDEGRQWFKARHGLPGATETPREHAFCAHAICGDAVFEVPDATRDTRFAGNPLVTGAPDIRFYAGAPLTLAGGERIGTLCVIDQAPRRLTAEQAALLQSLARIACDMLVMRRDLIVRALSVRSDHEAAVAASEARHRAIVEEQSELISLARPCGELVYANPAYGRHVGRTAAQLVGSNLYDFVEAGDRPAVKARIDAVLASGTAQKGENRIVSAGGAEVWIAWTNNVQLLPDGSRLLRSVGRDISDRKRAELALRSSQAFLQRTGRVAGVGGWELTFATGALHWSDETRRIHGVADDFEPTLETAIGFYAPEGRAAIEEAVHIGMTTGKGWDLELPMTDATGRAIWVRAVGEVEFEGGQAVRANGAFQDITAHKLLQQQIADSERFIRQITDNLPVRIAYADSERRYRFVNQAHCDQFRLPREAILGRTRVELFGRALDPRMQAGIDGVLAGQPQHFEFDETVAGGSTRRIESRMVPDRDADGEVVGFFATGTDITERSHAEQALRVLTTIVEVSTDFVVQADTRGAVLYMNPAARRVVGLAANAPLAGYNVADFNTEETNTLLEKVIVPAVRASGVWQGETTIKAADGTRLPVSHLVIAHRGADGRIERYSAVMRDISADVATRQHSARQSATLVSVTDALPVIVSAIDTNLRLRFVNTAFERWHGLSREQIVGRFGRDVLAADEIEQSKPWSLRALAGETVQFERHYPSRPGSPTLSVTYIPVRLPDGSVDGFVGVALDITPHRAEQTRLQALAERDPLTGLLNRAGFEARLRQCLERGEGRTLALLYIDLDHFKPVNDSHGHAVGDRLLQAFATRLQRLVRPTDAVARIGGDEFAVLLPGVRRPTDAQGVADKIVASARTPFTLDALTLRIGASLGLAMATEADAGDAGQALRARADAQLYRAKQRGRGRVAAEALG